MNSKLRLIVRVKYASKLSKNSIHLLQKMLTKNPKERMTLLQIKSHPWTTKNNTQPMVTSEENCMFIGVTEEEVKVAVKPAMSFLNKVCVF